jgi:peptide/nickel transport system substrate-binding protein
VDLATGLELLQEIPDDDRIIWQESTNTLSVTCFLNGYSIPFSQPEARLAVNLGVDVPAIVDAVWNGLAEPAATIVSPYHFGYPGGLDAHNYDPVRAKELFASCVMPEKLVLRTPLYMPDRALEVSRLIQEQLGQIGLAVEIDVGKDRPQYARDVGTKQVGHMAIFDSSPHSSFRVLQEKISSKVKGVWWQGVADEKADDLIDAAHRTVDPTDREMAYARCLSWLHESPHWLYLYHPTKLYAHRPGVGGVRVNHSGLLKLSAM